MSILMCFRLHATDYPLCQVSELDLDFVRAEIVFVGFFPASSIMTNRREERHSSAVQHLRAQHWTSRPCEHLEAMRSAVGYFVEVRTHFNHGQLDYSVPSALESTVINLCSKPVERNELNKSSIDSVCRA